MPIVEANADDIADDNGILLHNQPASNRDNNHIPFVERILIDVRLRKKVKRLTPIVSLIWNTSTTTK